MKKIYGLIGFPLSHSFSKRYFSDKFRKPQYHNYEYKNFELGEIGEFIDLIKTNPNLCGLNVTIPYKEKVMIYLDELAESAQKVGAVNVIKMDNGKLKGHNSDYFGFKSSIENWIPKGHMKALVLGTGGAAKAICAVLQDLDIGYDSVSRERGKDKISYDDLKLEPKRLRDASLVINTTPLGMSPNNETFPDIDFEQISSKHYLFDLIYNPEETQFLRKGRINGASTRNGLEMLKLQAEKSWEIWNK